MIETTSSNFRYYIFGFVLGFVLGMIIGNLNYISLHQNKIQNYKETIKSNEFEYSQFFKKKI